MNASHIDDLSPMPLNEPSAAGGLLPAFAAKQYTHLPTPQSPNDLGRYVHDGPHSPESPVPYGALSSGLQNQRDGNRRPDLESNLTQSQYISQQYATPESSPHFSRTSHLHYNNLATPLYSIPKSNNLSTPKQNLHVKLECPTAAPTPLDIPEHCISTSSSPSSEQPPHLSALSSPFVSKTPANLKERQILPVESQSPHLLDHSLPKCTEAAAISVTATLPSPQPSTSNSVPNAGGEIERARESMLEDRLVQIREAEKRRPEYLKRAKRMIPETDPNYLDNEDMLNNVGSLSVGIMESPHKGRRLKLFQETSEESFEESLMAGGYGRYRTADWVRQPQPVSLLPVATTAGSSTVVSILEEAEEAPPSEKEVKKRKRLAAFKFETPQNSHKLCAVELEGKGRVLLDYPAQEQNMPGSPEPVANKKRIANRRKKRGADAVVGKKAPGTSRDDDDQTEKPNWPDAEFPWRLRIEERIESAKAEEDERLRWIERFLDRDSDDEDETDSNKQHSDDATVQYEDFFQNLKSDLISDSAKGHLFPSGRGKMVLLPVYSDSTGKVSRLTAFPSDPADARAALLSKKSVRALSYRQKKRQRELDDEDDEEVVCICNGKDDGRELVQCDSCQTWYHLQCIGIKSIAELGKEEDPWFCRRCVRSPSPLVGGEDLPLSEPTFVPTDDLPNVRRPLEASFFPSSLQESPNWASPRMPRTPTRLSSSNYSWSNSSRAGPSTPQYSAQAVRIYSSPFDSNSQNYDESPFDPTSTPSRGIKFHAPFATPKGNSWLPRANVSLFHTPSRSFGRGSSHLGVLDQDVPNTTSAQEYFERVNSYDESPIRRSRTDISNSRHIFHSPSRSRTSIPNWSLLEESPVVRSLDSQATTEQSQQRTDSDSRFHERIS